MKARKWLRRCSATSTASIDRACVVGSIAAVATLRARSFSSRPRLRRRSCAAARCLATRDTTSSARAPSTTRRCAESFRGDPSRCLIHGARCSLASAAWLSKAPARLSEASGSAGFAPARACHRPSCSFATHSGGGGITLAPGGVGGGSLGGSAARPAPLFGKMRPCHRPECRPSTTPFTFAPSPSLLS